MVAVSIFSPEFALSFAQKAGPALPPTCWPEIQESIREGDQEANTYQHRMRVIVAGGDGTIAWVLAVIRALDLRPPPPVAIIPMGTGTWAGPMAP